MSLTFLFKISNYFLLFYILNIHITPGESKYSKSGLLDDEEFRLSGNIVPKSYWLEFRPILHDGERWAQFSVPSSVRITVQCTNVTNEIILHSSELEINMHSIRVVDNYTNTGLTIESLNLEPEFDFFKIKMALPLIEGREYDIYVLFVAKIWRDRLDGLYLLDYVEGTETKYIATTLFAPHNARRLYPCFDEPSYKATFQVTIHRLEKYKSRSNMEIFETKPDPLFFGWFSDEYFLSVKMSTYLFAFEVSELAVHTETSETMNTEVKVHARKELIDKNGGKYATDLSINALLFYKEYFNHPYELTKLDSIALPKFYYSAMENWGLITYNENVLIYIDGETTEEERWRITGIIGHEVAHQWFGNLVTCHWWNAVWLNEGFASYLAYLNYDPINNDFEPEKLFVNEEHQDALYFDAGPNTHAVASPVNDHNQISGVYDTIAYKKGASLLKMIQNFVTEEVFKDALNTYLARMKFQPVTQNDLFDAISHHSGLIEVGVGKITVREIMDSWTFQEGFPLLRVTVTGPNQINIYQSKYLNSSSTDSWWVPISISTQDEPKFNNDQATFWIPKDFVGISINHVRTNSCVIVNPEAAGFYRVEYDDTLSQNIFYQLQTDHKAIGVIARTQLVDDFLALAFNDVIGIENGIKILEFLSKETELSVWNSAIVYLNKFNDMSSSRSEYDIFKNIIGPKVIGALNAIGFEQQLNEKGPKVILRSKLLRFACEFDTKECVDYSVRLFADWESTTINRIPVDIRGIVYCTAITKRETDFYHFLISQYVNERIVNEKTRMLNALACSQNETTINTMLNSILEENSIIEKGDKLKFLQRFLINPFARSITYKFITENFSKFYKLLDETHDAVTTMVTEIKKYWNLPSEHAQLENFYNENKDTLNSVSASLLAALYEIQKNVEWRESYYEKLFNSF